MKNLMNAIFCGVFIFFSTSADVVALTPDDVKLSPTDVRQKLDQTLNGIDGQGQNGLTPDDVKLSPDDVKLPISLSVTMQIGEYLVRLSPDDVKQGDEDQIALSPDDVKHEIFNVLEQETYDGFNTYFLQRNPGELLLIVTESWEGQEHIVSVIQGNELLSENSTWMLLYTYMNLVDLNPELNAFPVLKIALHDDLEGGVGATLHLSPTVRVGGTFNRN